MSNGVAEKKRVLVVDDNPKLMNFMQLGLKFAGFEAVTADSGICALEAVRSNSLDIILLDIRMPDMDGFEVLRRLRKFSQIPVIAYSATPEYLTPALESGANAFLAKPFDMNQLTELINKLADHQE
jgi:two-component system KDP operon response regulator KdpE